MSINWEGWHCSGAARTACRRVPQHIRRRGKATLELPILHAKIRPKICLGAAIYCNGEANIMFSRIPLFHRNLWQCLNHLSIPPLKSTALKPSNTRGVEGEDTQAVGKTADRESAIEDCSRLALEAEQSLPIARNIGEALAVLSFTVSMANSSSPSQVVATVSSEVASAVVEAEGLVDDLLKVIQVGSHNGISL